MAYLSRSELEKMNFKRVGRDVRISRQASIYNAREIEIGDHVRVDDFAVLSAGDGGILIGSRIHIAVGCTLIGAAQITLSDFVNLSSRVAIYSSNDDYSGASLTSPLVPEEYKQITHEPVTLGRHVIVGTGSVILPGVAVADGVAIGALSLVTENCDAFGMYAGIPAKRIKSRKKDFLVLEEKLLSGDPG